MKLQNGLLMDTRFMNLMLNLSENDKLPTSLLCKMKDILIQILDNVKILEDNRIELVKKYGTEIETDGKKAHQVNKENIDIFMKEINILADGITEIDGEKIIYKIKNDEKLGFSIKDLDLLQNILVIEIE